MELLRVGMLHSWYCEVCNNKELEFRGFLNNQATSHDSEKFKHVRDRGGNGLYIVQESRKSPNQFFTIQDVVFPVMFTI